MGYMAWRERTIARLDARADRWQSEAETSKAEREAERVRADAQEHEDQQARQLELYRSTAASVGFDHDEVAARATTVGVDLPRLWKPSGRLLMAAGVVSALSLGGGNAGDLDASGSRYRMWVAGVVRAEQARGIDLPYPRR